MVATDNACMTHTHCWCWFRMTSRYQRSRWQLAPGLVFERLFSTACPACASACEMMPTAAAAAAASCRFNAEHR